MTWILDKMTREATLTEAGSGSGVPGLGVGAGISTRGPKEPPVQWGGSTAGPWCGCTAL